MIDKIKRLINELERNYLSVRCMRDGAWVDFRLWFIERMRYGQTQDNPYWFHFADGYDAVLTSLHESLREIRTSFIATTATGVFLHFVGQEDFPQELFMNSDVGYCRVFFERDTFGNRQFWLEFTEDPQLRRFYFTPPESLDMAALYGQEESLNEKERLFHTININMELNGIARSLTLKIDQDWLSEARGMG